MDHTGAAISLLDEAAHTGDVERVAAACHEIGLAIFDEDALGDELFGRVVALMRAPFVQRSSAAHDFMVQLDVNWDELSPGQRRELLPVLEFVFPLLADGMARYLVTVLLGERYRDEGALATVERLLRTSGDVARAELPHALEHLVLGADGESLRERASALLLQMQTDSAPEVRDAAVYALASLRRRAGR